MPRLPVGKGARNMPSRVLVVATVASLRRSRVNSEWSRARPSLEKRASRRAWDAWGRKPRR